MARNMKSMYSKEVNLSDFKMKKCLVFLFLTIISQIIVRAEIPLNYYNSAEGLNGSDLKKKLNEMHFDFYCHPKHQLCCQKLHVVIFSKEIFIVYEWQLVL